MPTCRRPTPRPCSSACRPNASARPPKSAPRSNEAAQRLRARADREAAIVLAEAASKGEQLRGEGDAERNRIFADAFGRDPDFFTFYRSMQAYEASMKAGETRLVLSPDSSFFRYFRDPFGGATAKPAAAAPGAN